MEGVLVILFVCLVTLWAYTELESYLYEDDRASALAQLAEVEAKADAFLASEERRLKQELNRHVSELKVDFMIERVCRALRELGVPE